MHFTSENPMVITEVRNFVLRERSHCVSDREWKHRLKGYGYDIRQTDRGQMLTTLPHGVEICAIDA